MKYFVYKELHSYTNASRRNLTYQYWGGLWMYDISCLCEQWDFCLVCEHMWTHSSKQLSLTLTGFCLRYWSHVCSKGCAHTIGLNTLSIWRASVLSPSIKFHTQDIDPMDTIGKKTDSGYPGYHMWNYLVVIWASWYLQKFLIYLNRAKDSCLFSWPMPIFFVFNIL